MCYQALCPVRCRGGGVDTSSSHLRAETCKVVGRPQGVLGPQWSWDSCELPCSGVGAFEVLSALRRQNRHWPDVSSARRSPWGRWLCQFLQLAPAIASSYLWVFVLFVSCKPAVPLHIWGRSEAYCWQGRRGGGGWFPFGKEGCSLGTLGFAALSTADELQLL